MERQGKLFADLGYPVIRSSEACTQVCRTLCAQLLVDVTDFRLSRSSGENRVGGCRDVDACRVHLCALECR